MKHIFEAVENKKPVAFSYENKIYRGTIINISDDLSKVDMQVSHINGVAIEQTKNSIYEVDLGTDIKILSVV